MALAAEQFLKDVAGHKMELLLDAGIHRHLKFRSSSWNQWFEIVSWPGSLSINGDMGSWTFSRVDDMFDFFRSKELRINKQYWAEKIQSEDRVTASKKFDQDYFAENVIESLDGYSMPNKKRKAIIADLKEQGAFDTNDEAEAYRNIVDFEHDGFTFSDVWEISGRAYTFRFVWCLHAIVWGIQQYNRLYAEQHKKRALEAIGERETA